MVKTIFKTTLTIILFFLFYNCSSFYPFQKQKAVNMAKEYLENRYTQEMKYMFVHTPLEGQAYHIYFSPIEDDTIRFEICISYDLSEILFDNYQSIRFGNYSKQYFQSKMENVWTDNNMRVWFWISSERHLYRNYNEEIDENINVEELKHYVGLFFIVIIMDYILDDTIIENESSKILEAINIIREKNYEPDNIQIWYNNGKEISYAKHQHITFYKTSNNELPIWQKINTEQEIIEILKKELNK